MKAALDAVDERDPVLSARGLQLGRIADERGRRGVVGGEVALDQIRLGQQRLDVAALRGRTVGALEIIAPGASRTR